MLKWTREIDITFLGEDVTYLAPVLGEIHVAMNAPNVGVTISPGIVKCNRLRSPWDDDDSNISRPEKKVKVYKNFGMR